VHAPSIARQFRQTGHVLDADGHAWVTIVPTGQSRTTCPCGADTGMIADADALAAYRTHQDGGAHAPPPPVPVH
jgi:hypothetical protein